MDIFKVKKCSTSLYSSSSPWNYLARKWMGRLQFTAKKNPDVLGVSLDSNVNQENLHWTFFANILSFEFGNIRLSVLQSVTPNFTIFLHKIS